MNEMTSVSLFSFFLKYFQVLYPPGAAAVSSGSRLVYKGRSVRLVCSLQERGRPATNNFVWFKVRKIFQEKTKNISLSL